MKLETLIWHLVAQMHELRKRGIDYQKVDVLIHMPEVRPSAHSYIDILSIRPVITAQGFITIEPVYDPEVTGHEV